MTVSVGPAGRTTPLITSTVMDAREVTDTRPVAMETTISSLKLELSCTEGSSRMFDCFQLYSWKVDGSQHKTAVTPAAAGHEALAWRWWPRWSGSRGPSNPEKTGIRCSHGNLHRGWRCRGRRSTRRRRREQWAAPGQTETAEDAHCLRIEEGKDGHDTWLWWNMNKVRCRTNHVSLSVSDVSEDGGGAAMSQTADHPLLHVLQQLLQRHNTHSWPASRLRCKIHLLNIEV